MYKKNYLSELGDVFTGLLIIITLIYGAVRANNLILGAIAGFLISILIYLVIGILEKKILAIILILAGGYIFSETSSIFFTLIYFFISFVVFLAIKDSYENNLKESTIKQIRNNEIKYIDIMTGEEFEDYLIKLFASLGYEIIKKTPASNDFGADIIVKGIPENVSCEVKIAIQAKRYKNKVGIKAVQETGGVCQVSCRI